MRAAYFPDPRGDFTLPDGQRVTERPIGTVVAGDVSRLPHLTEGETIEAIRLTVGATLVPVPVKPVRPVPVPEVVSPAQMREWLIRAGQLDAVAAALAAIPDPTQREVMQSWCEYAIEVRRDNPKVDSLAATLGLDAAALDAAFVAAAKL